jgi:hypothetical protein
MSCKYKDYVIFPVINSLSDHDAKISILDNVLIQNYYKCTYSGRKINSSSLMDFKLNLSHEPWDNIITNADIDKIFNNFLNSYVGIFNSSFPIKKLHIQHRVV